MATQSKASKVLLWVFTILTASLIFFAGFSKLTDPVKWDAEFVHMGYPGAMHWVVGFVETLGGLLLLLPATAPYAAIVLAGTMGGATLTHLLLPGEALHGLFPLSLMVIYLAIGWARRPGWVQRILS